MLFIVKGSVEMHVYMADSPASTSEFMYPVEAMNEEDARYIVERHYTKNDSPYSHWYAVHIDDVFPTLSR